MGFFLLIPLCGYSIIYLVLASWALGLKILYTAEEIDSTLHKLVTLRALDFEPYKPLFIKK